MTYCIVTVPQSCGHIEHHRLLFDKNGEVFGAENLVQLFSEHDTFVNFLLKVVADSYGCFSNITWQHE